ncbi:MAG: hypothetical protein ACXWC4_03575 [Telluria sp.]
MKIHPLNCLIAVLLGALLTYGIAAIDSNTMKATVAVGCFLFLVTTLAGGVGITFERSRAGANVRIVSMVFFVLGLFLNLFFAMFAPYQTSYIITSGVLFLVYVLIAQAIFTSAR